MTTKYKFEAIHTDNAGFETTTTKEFYADSLVDIIPDIKEFLFGVGFSPISVDKYISHG